MDLSCSQSLDLLRELSSLSGPLESELALWKSLSWEVEGGGEGAVEAAFGSVLFLSVDLSRKLSTFLCVHRYLLHF